MKATDIKEKTPVQSHGRGLLIAVVIIFSSLSFTLGFFVGKNSGDRKPDVAGVPEAAPVATPAPQDPQSPQALPEEASDIPGQNPARAPEEKQEVTHHTPPMPPNSGTVALTAHPGGPAPHTAKERSKEAAKENVSSAETKTFQEENDVKYTVQLGALKSQAEAKKLRMKLEKKGYKTFVIISTNKKNHEKIYKIRTGEFNDRKEAEMLALKLKKTEDLHAFVTPKD